MLCCNENSKEHYTSRLTIVRQKKNQTFKKQLPPIKASEIYIFSIWSVGLMHKLGFGSKPKGCIKYITVLCQQAKLTR